MKLYIKQKVFSWRDRFTIKDENENDRYFAEGEFFTLGKQLHVYDESGRAVAHIRQKLMSLMPRFIIEVHGREACEIVQKFRLTRHTFDIHGLPLNLDGDFWGHEYDLFQGSQIIMQLSKKWFTWGDSYEMNIADSNQELVCLCIALAVDCALAVSRNN